MHGFWFLVGPRENYRNNNGSAGNMYKTTQAKTTTNNNNQTKYQRKYPDGTITRHVYQLIRADILNGVLRPGQKLKIEDISNAYQAGISPVREALNLLTNFGFVDRKDNRGFQVRNISAEEFDDLLKVRCWVEERALRESIAHGALDWEERITLAMFRLERMGSSNAGAIDWDLMHKDFHVALLSGCNSEIFLTYCEYLHEQNVRYRQLAGIVSGEERDTHREHQKIAKAALAHDADSAVNLLMEHYKTTGRYLKFKLFP